VCGSFFLGLFALTRKTTAVAATVGPASGRERVFVTRKTTVVYLFFKER